MREDDGFQLDRRVSIAFVVTIISMLFGNIVAGVWYAATLNSRVASIEQWITDNKATERRLSVIEARMGSMEGSLARIEQQLGTRSPAQPYQ